MEKYTALLIPAYLSGFALAVLLVTTITLTPEATTGFFNFMIPPDLALFLIAGALTGMITIFLARGISYLFLDSSQ
uniref:Uncharacterized protein n=1 Tax=uncultured Thiotrichaceae bacterium TaxID=298394 RepID=A0A6S6UH88_9GAMM|nr:MAG: Unknown protein [uncultured Thiotrichaceae bacterium]